MLILIIIKIKQQLDDDDDNDDKNNYNEKQKEEMINKTNRKVIKLDDYMHLMSYLTKNQLEYENLMTKIFNDFDLDGDGFIKLDDLRQFMKMTFASIELNDDDIAEMIKVADLNNDGVVDMEGK